MTRAYAELAAVTNFSFLRGGSHPHELVETAAQLGLAAIGIADRNSLAGIVRAHVAAKEYGIRLVVGVRLILEDGFEVLCFPTDRAAYGRLAKLLTVGNRRAAKGECHLRFDDLAMLGDGQRFIAMPPGPLPSPACGRGVGGEGNQPREINRTARNTAAPPPSPLTPLPQAGEGDGANSWKSRTPIGKNAHASSKVDAFDHFTATLAHLAGRFPGAVYLALSPLYRGDDRVRFERLAALAKAAGAPLIATNDVLYHAPDRRPLQDLLTCIREHCTIDEAGFRLERNAERHIKAPEEMARLLSGYEEAIARTTALVGECRFSLDELSYEYPDEPAGMSASPQEELERLAWLGAEKRFPEGLNDNLRNTIAHELQLIGELNFASYFLTVYDIVRFARAQNPPILCQGRGSAANSAVCYCLGITSVNPAEIDLLFERFISAERGEPPDIDVDFEHERREEVIQYIYNKYGRHRAGLAATVITYRARSAMRETGKAMGLSPDVVGALAGIVWGSTSKTPPLEQVRQAGLDPLDKRLLQTLTLARRLAGFPRHLSQHVGGFVITRGALDEVVPIANAAMEDRTVVEWDKDDLDALGILKIDVLALGMLSCIRKAFELLDDHYGVAMTLADVPREDPATYRMIQKADTLGVFQIESRAQMSMLPRLRPENFYDLVIQIAIVRPGPIQGDMVHPYLRRRQGLEKVEYPSQALRAVLEKTLGVPLFQEQAMKIAIVGAGFTPADADRLRRAMATFRHTGDIGQFQENFIAGMIGNGYTPDFAERCFKQIEGFSDYGFPESHSASFALLAYASAWLKCHYPDVFACALLNSQPMGFYSSSSIVRDFREHDGEARPADINHSTWDHRLEAATGGNAYALRLGLRQIEGLREDAARRIVEARGKGYKSVRDLYFRTRIDAGALRRLAHADAFRSIGLDRRAALWAVEGLNGYHGKRAAAEDLPLFAHAAADAATPLQDEAAVALPIMQSGEHVVEDYETLRLSLKAHPVSFLRSSLDRRGVACASALAEHPAGRWARIAGLVLVRQRPGTASGVVFMTLEDETGIANVIVWSRIFDEHRRIIMGARMVAVEGELQKEQGVIHLVARRFTDLTPELMAALAGAPAQSNAPRAPAQEPHRHPRQVRALPKGRNFH